MKWDILLQILGGGIGGSILTKLVEKFFLSKKDERSLDAELLQRSLDRIEALEKKYDELIEKYARVERDLSRSMAKAELFENLYKEERQINKTNDH